MLARVAERRRTRNEHDPEDQGQPRHWDVDAQLARPAFALGPRLPQRAGSARRGSVLSPAPPRPDVRQEWAAARAGIRGLFVTPPMLEPGRLSCGRLSMSDPFAKNQATSAAEAATISPRAEFRVFGRGVIEVVEAAHVERQDRAVPGAADAGGDLLPVGQHQRGERQGPRRAARHQDQGRRDARRATRSSSRAASSSSR